MWVKLTLMLPNFEDNDIVDEISLMQRVIWKNMKNYDNNGKESFALGVLSSPL